MWRSNCCGALPMWDVDEFDGEYFGLCGDCAEHTDFNYEELEKEK